ncbi:ABC transporter substrate-binding protein [Haloquadratum walsbyi]|uniref:ABC-type transport system periplasmic substrate-binding protein (Probable substrate dipeptide/oligopeptide) n=1 Tax=Haloquadratum walsbyi (strain DSM 16790 / HBSQ001) TaxID=362976 RepID=Q18KK7_HALWD|nr:ABC transporter substrate-binding protein [Haloquadratum walsbyi]CAJ51439.1 ABC-type transport system periplasmic substrate-binding protein (probable substrate dipeptide/oligopeptide) [Haloquadratum walsbyi DSM 16790]
MSDESRERDIDRRSFVKLAGTATATAALAGCGSSGGGGGAEGGDETAGTSQSGETAADTDESTTGSKEFPVTITQGQMPDTLDPHDHRNIPADIVMRQCYEGVISRNRQGQIVSMLATEWRRVEPGRARFSIREGPTFQQTDNQLTPADIAYTINRMVDDDVGFTSPQAGQLGGVTGAEVVDDERAVDVLSDGLNPIVFAEFAIYCDVVEQAWTEENESSYVAQNMNGTGPFELAEYEQNVQVTFDRYDEYWREPAEVTQLTFTSAQQASARVNQLIAGETDIIVNVPPQSVNRVDSSESVSVNAVGSTRIIYNGMRSNAEPFSSLSFRRAMNFAVDLESIITDVLQEFGEQTGQPTLQPFFGYNDDIEPYAHDPAEAERLIEESGHAGASLTLHTPVGRYLKDLQIAQAVAGMIDDLSNVSCDVKQRDFNTLASELTDGDITTGPKFYLIGWGNATFDASQTVNPTLTSDGVLTSFKSDQLDSLITEANQTAESEQREQLLQQANAFSHEQAPWIFLNRQFGVYGSTNRIDWQPRNDERIDAYSISSAE